MSYLTTTAAEWRQVGLREHDFQGLTAKLAAANYTRVAESHWRMLALLANLAHTATPDRLFEKIVAESTRDLLLTLTRVPWTPANTRLVQSFVCGCLQRSMHSNEMLDTTVETIVDATLWAENVCDTDTSPECVSNSWVTILKAHWDKPWSVSVLNGLLQTILRGDDTSNVLADCLYRAYRHAPWAMTFCGSATAAEFITAHDVASYKEAHIRAAFRRLTGSGSKLPLSAQEWTTSWRTTPAWFEAMWEDPPLGYAKWSSYEEGQAWSLRLAGLLEAAGQKTTTVQLPDTIAG